MTFHHLVLGRVFKLRTALGCASHIVRGRWLRPPSGLLPSISSPLPPWSTSHQRGLRRHLCSPKLSSNGAKNTPLVNGVSEYPPLWYLPDGRPNDGHDYVTVAFGGGKERFLEFLWNTCGAATSLLTILIRTGLDLLLPSKVSPIWARSTGC